MVASVILIGVAVYWAFARARSDGLTLQSGVAVLPFANLSEDPADEYFSNGLSEEIIGALSRINGLRVSGHASSSAFKSRQQDIHEIGQKLGVGSVLDISRSIVNAQDQAFVYLTNAYEKHDRALAVIKVEPLVDNLRTDSRYDALLKKIGLQ